MWNYRGCAPILRLGLTLLGCIHPNDGANASAQGAIDRRDRPVSGVVLTAVLSESAVSPGAPALLELTTRNEGRDAQRLVESSPLYDFTLVVQSDRGDAARPRKAMRGALLAYHTATLGPDSEMLAAYPLDEAYDLSRVGTYRITAMRRINTPDLEHTTEVVSNTTFLIVSKSLSKDFVLSCSTGQPTTGSGTPVILHIRLRNVSSKGKTVLLGGALGGYDLRVQDFRGDLLHPKIPAGPATGRATGGVLHAGASADTDVDLSRLYDLTKGPRYFITAMHNVPGRKGKQNQVYSNTVVLTVTH